MALVLSGGWESGLAAWEVEECENNEIRKEGGLLRCLSNLSLGIEPSRLWNNIKKEKACKADW